MSELEPIRGGTAWDRLREQQAVERPSRFSTVTWIGLALLLVAAGVTSVYFLGETLGILSPSGATPRAFATPTPRGSPTPIPTPAPIAWLWVDCEPDAACADEPALREEMASFLARGLGLSALDDVDAFGDIADSPYRGDINALAAAGLTTGCGPTEYCPGGHVTREQMATFLQRAFDLPNTTLDFYDDDEGSSHEAAINAVAAAGVATPCGQRLFCPGELVQRAELAGYLSRVLEVP